MLQSKIRVESYYNILENVFRTIEKSYYYYLFYVQLFSSPGWSFKLLNSFTRNGTQLKDINLKKKIIIIIRYNVRLQRVYTTLKSNYSSIWFISNVSFHTTTIQIQSIILYCWLMVKIRPRIILRMHRKLMTTICNNVLYKYEWFHTQINVF